MLTLGVRRYSPGPKNSHGIPAPLYSAPIPWQVYGYGPGENTEPAAPNRNQSTHGWVVYAPTSENTPTEHDLVVIAGEDYHVDGRPKDYTHGPWPHPTAGIEVHLTRTEG